VQLGWKKKLGGKEVCYWGKIRIVSMINKKGTLDLKTYVSVLCQFTLYSVYTLYSVHTGIEVEYPSFALKL
jgi:hypothetical protein